jgi:DNA-binding GntR family transcriptional regulator
MSQRGPDSHFGISTGERVADYVRSLVWSGELRAGDRVRQADIASALGMSRIPVREGLVALESEGLVRHEPQRGVFVARLDRAFVTDHYALLGLVLGYVIDQAVRRGDHGFKKELGDLSERVAQAETAEELFPLAVQFKELCCSTGGSARARAAVASMERLVPGNLHAQIPQAITVTRAGIPAIAEAIAANDGERAAVEMRTMTRELGAVVLADLVRRGLIVSDPEAPDGSDESSGDIDRATPTRQSLRVHELA